MGEIEKEHVGILTRVLHGVGGNHIRIYTFFFLFSPVIFICLFTKGAPATVWWIVSGDRNSLVRVSEREREKEGERERENGGGHLNQPKNSEKLLVTVVDF